MRSAICWRSSRFSNSSGMMERPIDASSSTSCGGRCGQLGIVADGYAHGFLLDTCASRLRGRDTTRAYFHKALEGACTVAKGFYATIFLSRDKAHRQPRICKVITLSDIAAARARIHGVAVRTPLVPLHDSPSAPPLYLKAESLQPVGAFKIRGAYNKIASLPDEEKARGVIAFSSGNHAQGVAYAARALGVQATIVMPAIAPEVKKAKTRKLGAEIVELSEGSEEDWRVAAEAMAAERGYAMVPPFDDEVVIAGAGTAGLEICEDLPDVGLVLAPIGGGGLLSGVAAAMKLNGSNAKVVGVEPELAGDARASFQRGEIVEFDLDQTRQTMADGMRATRIGNCNFEHMQAFVDDMVVVSEEEIAEAMRRITLDARLVVEPSGAVAAAAWLFRRDELPATDNAVAFVSGGNVDPSLLAEILAG